VADDVEIPLADPAYGRFSRRLRAFVIDWIVIMLLLVTALFVAVSMDSDRVGRILGFTFVGVWLLYEPLLVCLTGSSIGHYLSNLRVVDNKTHSNVGFPKAVARLVIKTTLGLYSFITMATTSRHQAVHDLMTGSTVQIRDRSKASPHHYVAERAELSSPAMPSRMRRSIIIFGYVFGTYVFYTMVMIILMASNIISRSCGLSKRCAGAEGAMMTTFALIWLGIAVLLVIQGWRGRLYGCRARSEIK
jgi:uncharacterized RDD family membrane protein YckC